jgi:hypothetical protein
MTSWAEPDLIRRTSFRERLGFSESPERRGRDTYLSGTLLVELAQPPFSDLSSLISEEEVSLSSFNTTFFNTISKSLHWARPYQILTPFSLSAQRAYYTFSPLDG